MTAVALDLLTAERDSLLVRVDLQRQEIERQRAQIDRLLKLPKAPREKPITWSGKAKISELTLAAALARGYFDDCLCSLDNCQQTGFETDLLVVDKRMRVIDVEIKLSRADLKRDRDKSKWRYEWKTNPKNGRPTLQRVQSETPADWPAGAWKHFVAAPAEIWNDKLFAHMSPASGLLLIEDRTPEPAHWRVLLHRKAQPNKAVKPLAIDAMRQIARLQTFRLWAAYKAAGWVGAEVAK